jgi:hypothetical protein
MSTLTIDRNSKAIQVLRPDSTITVSATTGASTASSALSSSARVARIVARESVYYEINGTASSSTVYLPQNAVEYVHVYAGDTISFKAVSTDGTVHITEMV